jgi:hypothetical protein
VTARAASHVLLIEPVDYRFNQETSESNVFQRPVEEAAAGELSRRAIEQHRALRHLLVENGVRITVARSRTETPDAPFCNNWFSTHRRRSADGSQLATLVLYPLLAPNRRLERRADLVELLRCWYPSVIDFSARETAGRFLESTGSLCLDDEAKVAYAAISPRTDRALAEEWARASGYRLVAFTATDASGTPYYHTNVMMFLGHGLAGICLEAIGAASERAAVEAALRKSGLEVLPLTRAQVASFCGNCLALESDLGDPLFLMSSAAHRAFSERERAAIAARGRIIHTDLSVFEEVGGGSARCLVGELS